MNKKLSGFLLRYILFFLLILIAFFGLFMWWAVGNSFPQRTELTTDKLENTVGDNTPKELTFATYNIGHGHGLKEKPWHHRDKKTTEIQLHQIADAISQMSADVVMLQEVDIDSKRSHHINQIEFLKNKTKYQYSACAVLWQKNYIPFPYWPPADHIGKVTAANCILSRYPITKHERIIFDKPKSNPFWYNWGYLDYGIERVDINVNNKIFAVLNVHLEAWDRDSRIEQIKKIHNYVREIHLPVILGGDFNTVPVDAPKKSGFSDEPETDYSYEDTFLWFFNNQENLKLGKLLSNKDNPYENTTFPSDNPDRKLDHIFVISPSLSISSYRIFFDAKTASDHLPVVAKIVFE